MFMDIVNQAIGAVVKHGGFNTEDLPWLLWASVSKNGEMPKEPPFKNG